MRSNPCQGVFDCNELMERISSYLPWPMWVRLSNVSRGTRDTLHGALRTRMRFFISRFINWKQAPDFFKLLESTNTLVAGSVVRCMLSVDIFYLYQDTNPLQLNIVVPYGRQDLLSENGSLEYRRWRRLLYGCGYRDEFGTSPGDVPKHLAVTAKTWSVLISSTKPNRTISLIQSRTPSALSPVLQSCHTSNFFALSASRIYCLYPSLFAKRVNLSIKDHAPILRCAFDSFNYGLLSFTQTDEWNVFSDGSCGEACPCIWRRTRNLRGVAVYRWGGFYGRKDTGLTVSRKDNYGNMDELWKVQGECSNRRCPTVYLCTSLYQAIF